MKRELRLIIAVTILSLPITIAQMVKTNRVHTRAEQTLERTAKLVIEADKRLNDGR